MFSDSNAIAMQFTDDIIFMLLTEEFARNFNEGKTIAD